MSKSKPVPLEHFPSPGEVDDALRTPEIELNHVREVYDRVASQWAGTRYKAWPEVERFLREECQKNDLLGEIGCGNGKNLNEALNVTHSPVVIANDVSLPLCEITALQIPRAEVHAADIVSLPLRSDVFDVVICIAVLHHLSTLKRRQMAVKECARVLKPGGKALFFAWALEQEEGVSGHAFPVQDVFVPFHQKTYLGAVFPPKHVDEGVGHGVLDETKRSVVFQRYCHVFVKGEVEDLVKSTGMLTVERTFIDAGNWGVVCRRI